MSSVKKSTIIKAALALIVPGGLIMWAFYELGRKNSTINRDEKQDSEGSCCNNEHDLHSREDEHKG